MCRRSVKGVGLFVKTKGSGALPPTDKISIIGAMSLVRFLIMVAVGTLLSWAAWTAVLLTLDPFANPVVGPLLFYVSGWLAVVGTMVLAGFFVRHWFERDGVPFVQIATALRQGLLLASVIVMSLVLQRAGVLNAWTLLLLLCIAVGIEFFYWASQPDGQRHRAS